MAPIKQISWNVFDALPEPVLALDGNRKIIFANNAALNLLGEAIQGEDISIALRQPAILALAEAALAGKNPDPDEIKISKGTPQIFEVRAAPLLGNSIAKALISLQETTLVKQAEGIRSTFVANVSHELRSPLASLVGFIETLRGAAKDDPEAQDKFLKIMQNEASRTTIPIPDDFRRLIKSLVIAKDHLALMINRAAVYDHTLAGHEIRIRRNQEQHGAS